MSEIAGKHKRSYGIDVARGFCLVLMTFDHIPHGFAERFSDANFGPFGFFTGASGFLFLSGLVSSWVYGSVFKKKGPRSTWNRSIKRTGQIYLVNTALFILILAGISLHILNAPFWKSEFPMFFASPGKALFLGLLFLYKPLYFDILPIYILVLPMTTLMLSQIRSGRRWLVIGFSICAYMAVQIFVPEATRFQAMAYQLYFVFGFLIGSIGDLKARLLTPKLSRFAYLSISLSAVLLLARLGMGVRHETEFAIPYWNSLVNLEKNGPLRIANFMLFAFSAAYLWLHLPGKLKEIPPLRWLSFLGQHSLAVFTWSILLSLSFLAFLSHSSLNHFLRLTSMILVIFSLTIPAQFELWYTGKTPRIRQDPPPKKQKESPGFL